MKNIPFSPPDITEKEIENVVEVLKSSWITTGPKTKLLEEKIANYCTTERAICLNSATACMEMCLKMLGVGPGDEVITTAYTYTASASVIDHVGAKIVLVDTEENSFNISPESLEKAITERTKVIIPVDIAGIPCDYEKIYDVVNRKKNLFVSKNQFQSHYSRVIILADAAHALGATYRNTPIGSVADFTSFSFHAVKNLTTAEGGALTWKSLGAAIDNEIYKKINIFSLHGQTKDALAKTKLGSWEYDIIDLAYKCNMTDVHAAIGLAQMDRYENIVEKREILASRYCDRLNAVASINLIEHFSKSKTYKSSYHLMITNIMNSKKSRNKIIEELASRGISANVHYKPLPLLTAYKNKGFNIEDFPNSNKHFENEITLPLYSTLSIEDVDFICDNLISILGE